MICFPNAKINLGLHVINKREDGFHTIETVFYPVPCCEMLEMVRDVKWKQGKPKASFLHDGLEISGSAADNLVVKAYHLLDETFDLDPVQVFLYKKIPMGAGLGGGSADAAFAIRLLNDLFNLKMDTEKMKAFASQLGSDCAFFIENKPAYALGKGHELEPVAVDLSHYHIVLLYPQVHSSTALAYKNVLKRGALNEATSLKQLLMQPVKEWKHAVENDFERSVFEAIPQLPVIKQQLYDHGALYASMSGSGSTVFGIFDHEPVLSGALQPFICR